nr:MAG TPA: hypothetical protein [Caudoviricetes sp.]
MASWNGIIIRRQSDDYFTKIIIIQGYLKTLIKIGLEYISHSKIILFLFSPI